jgi:hypothetical protein
MSGVMWMGGQGRAHTVAAQRTAIIIIADRRRGNRLAWHWLLPVVFTNEEQDPSQRSTP